MILLGRIPFRWGAPPPPPPPSQVAGFRIFGRWTGVGFGARSGVVTPTKKHVGWMPEWRLRHDPEDLERRLKAQRESFFSPKWLDRFFAAEEEARQRIAEAKSAAHRAALEQAVELTAARVSEALDAGWAAPEQLIKELESAANATRVTASIKHAEFAARIAKAYLDYEDEEEIALLLQ